MSTMKFNTLNIQLKETWRAPALDNPYIATLSVGYNDNSMIVRLPNEVTERILHLCKQEIARGAQEQVNEFVSGALSYLPSQAALAPVTIDDAEEAEKADDTILF